MNLKIHLKALSLLCILPVSNIFSAHPGFSSKCDAAPVIPASLQAELKLIDEMPVDQLLAEVVTYPKEVAEKVLSINKVALQGYLKSTLGIIQAKSTQFAFKYWAIKKELTLCPEGALRQILHDKLDEVENKYEPVVQKEVKCIKDAIKNEPAKTYNLMVVKSNLRAALVSLLLAQKEELEKELQQEKTQRQQKEIQWQQEKAQLQAVINGYNILENGLQIEGMPHAPGGINPNGVRSKLKRSDSF